MSFRNQRRTGFAVLLSMLGLLYGSLAIADKPAGKALVLYNWESYLDPEIIKSFHAETGIQVVERYYDTDEAKDHKLAATQRGEGFDLIVGSGVSLRALAESGWLATIPASGLPNLANIHERWWAAYGSLRQYAVPYFWGTVGLAYRSDLVARPESWMDFFQPDSSVQGKLLLIDDSKDAFGAALKVLGYSMNSVEPMQLKQAMALLEGVLPHLREIGYFDYDENSALATGEVVLSMAYSGDVLSLQEFVSNVEYVVPREGTNLWLDYLAVFASSPNQQAAFQFIDYVNRPKIAAQNARYVNYATPNAAAEKYLPAEFLSDPILYPPKEVLKISETYEAMTSVGTRQRNRLFSTLRD